MIALREAVQSAPRLDEVIKWGTWSTCATGPVLPIRAEEERVLFGFWRGQRLREIEPRLEPGGKYEMATIELHEGDRAEDELTCTSRDTGIGLALVRGLVETMGGSVTVTGKNAEAGGFEVEVRLAAASGAQIGSRMVRCPRIVPWVS